MTQKRSAERCTRTMELPGLPPPPPVDAPLPPRVGGRQAAPTPPRGGGGYLNGRTPSELQKDPRLAELAEIGLSALWLQIAEFMGYEKFVEMWRWLDGQPELRDDSNQIALTLRKYRSYERYQRNRYVETLVAAGMSTSQIQVLVNKHLGEKLTWRHCKRLVAGAKVPA